MDTATSDIDTPGSVTKGSVPLEVGHSEVGGCLWLVVYFEYHGLYCLYKYLLSVHILNPEIIFVQNFQNLKLQSKVVFNVCYLGLSVLPCSSTKLLIPFHESTDICHFFLKALLFYEISRCNVWSFVFDAEHGAPTFFIY